MTAQPDPYVRVYYRITDDPKFAEVYDDDAALATWLRLLINADAMFPAAAPIPAGTDPEVLAKLIELEVVDPVGSTRYRIHGLESERTRRSEAGRANASKRWTKPDATAMPPHSDRNATAMRPHMPPHSGPIMQTDALRSSPIRATPSLAEPMRADAREDTPDVMDVWYRLTGSWPSPKVTPWLNQLGSDYGEAEVIIAIAEEWKLDPDRATVIGRARDRLAKARHDAGKAAEKAQAERETRERQAIEEMPEEQRAANLRRLREMMRDAGLGGEE